jgi:hypothetical protein
MNLFDEDGKGYLTLDETVEMINEAKNNKFISKEFFEKEYSNVKKRSPL